MFTDKIESSHQDSTARRIGIVNEKIRHSFTVNEKTNSDLWMGPTPEGMYAFKVFGFNNENLELWMRKYFDEIEDNNLLRENSWVSKERGLTFSPSNTPQQFTRHGKAMDVEKFKDILSMKYRPLSIIVSKIENQLKHLLKLDQKSFENEATVTFVKYESKKGLWMHIDNVLRSNGLVCSVGVGPHVVYDMAPTLLSHDDQIGKDGFVIRTKFAPGTMILLDGPARMQWAHSLPYDIVQEKYTILFLLNHRPDAQKIGFDKIVEAPIYRNLYIDVNGYVQSTNDKFKLCCANKEENSGFHADENDKSINPYFVLRRCFGTLSIYGIEL